MWYVIILSPLLDTHHLLKCTLIASAGTNGYFSCVTYYIFRLLAFCLHKKMTRKWLNKFIVGDKVTSSNVLLCQKKKKPVNITPEKLEPVKRLLKDVNRALLVMCLLLPEALSATQCCSGSSAQSDIWLNNQVLFVYMLVEWLTALNRTWVGRVEGMTTFEDHQPVLVKHRSGSMWTDSRDAFRCTWTHWISLCPANTGLVLFFSISWIYCGPQCMTWMKVPLLHYCFISLWKSYLDNLFWFT